MGAAFRRTAPFLLACAVGCGERAARPSPDPVDEPDAGPAPAVAAPRARADANAPDGIVAADAQATPTPPGLDGAIADVRASAGPDGGGSDAAAADPVAGAGRPVKLTGNLGFLEGPMWLAGPGVTWFVNHGTNRQMRLVPPTTVEPLATAEIGSTALDPRGTLVMAGPGRVVRIDLQGKLVEVLGSGFQSANDVIVRRDGIVYFTDHAGQRVWRITPDRKATAVATMTKPNGILLSHDQNVLYVSDSTDRLVRRFRVAADGAVDGGALFASTGSADVPDGMCLDDAGNVYVTTIPGLLVFTPAGVRRGNLPIPGEGPTNCSFGGRDRKTLYVTTNRALWSIEMPIPGVP